MSELIAYIAGARLWWFYKMSAPGSAPLARQIALWASETSNTGESHEINRWMEADVQWEETLTTSPGESLNKKTEAKTAAVCLLLWHLDEQDFLQMLRKREGEQLDTWLASIQESDLPDLESFAHEVEQDKAAVQAGLTLPINNGQVEGHATRIQLIKRMMYGKAGFALLHQHVLHRV